MAVPLSSNEKDRLAALKKYKILDTDPEKSFDDLTYLASFICESPISLVSIIDEKRQWVKSTIGIDAKETARNISFYTHAILEPELFIVPDALNDERFAKNPLVLGDPKIRFYAGAPFHTPEGEALGTLCVIDRVPRHLNENQKKALEVISRQVSTQLELRKNLIELNEALNTIKMLGGLLPICASCKSIRDEKDEWHALEAYIESRSDASFTHGICPECSQRLYPEIHKKKQ